jgi:glutamyl/glutaminyl-tRNA synthetase
MAPQETSKAPAAAPNHVTGNDIVEILRVRGWLADEPSAAQLAWCERAAALLGPQVTDRRSLGDLLDLVFHYDAQEILAKVESHSVLARYAARDVLRHLALLLLDGTMLGTERFKEVVNALKEKVGIGSRELFHPVRLALTGRAGEGELDRVILLLDEAATASFNVRVKTARERVVEFCAALD